MFYLMIGRTPYCAILGCTAGAATAKESGVNRCSYPTADEVHAAASKLRVAGYSNVRVIAGDCPAMEALRAARCVLRAATRPPVAVIAPTIVTGPADWLSYLLNGDSSMLSEGDRRRADAWRKREGIRHVLDINGDDVRFTWQMPLYAPELGVAGGNVVDYVVELE